MSLFRHHALLLDQRELTDQPLTGRSVRVRPSDGDPVHDHDQAWRLFVELHREDAGNAAVQLWTSYDGVAWVRVARVPAAAQASVATFVSLPAFAPFVQARTVLAAPQRTGERLSPQPRHRATVRLVSNGSFTVVPA